MPSPARSWPTRRRRRPTAPWRQPARPASRADNHDRPRLQPLQPGPETIIPPGHAARTWIRFEEHRRFSRFFIDRPIFAAVIADLYHDRRPRSGYFFLLALQYPEIVPLTVHRHAAYPGASAETVARRSPRRSSRRSTASRTCSTSSSQSTGDGKLPITVTFKTGTDLDAAQVLVQNRVASAAAPPAAGGAAPRRRDQEDLAGLPAGRQPDLAWTARSTAPISPTTPRPSISDRLPRFDGVGDVQQFGARDYAMRVWIDPAAPLRCNLTAGEIVAALRANVQVAPARSASQPHGTGSAFQLNVETQGRFYPIRQQFANVVIRTDAQGRQVKAGDVARVEIGADDYGHRAYLPTRMTSVIIPIFQRPGSNALASAESGEGRDGGRWRTDFPRASNTRSSTTRPSSSTSRSTPSCTRCPKRCCSSCS